MASKFQLDEVERLKLKNFMLNLKATYAILMDKFNLTPDRIAKLTDRQIYEFYLHPRTKDGCIKTPPPLDRVDLKLPDTFESDARLIDSLSAMFNLAQKDKDDAIAKLKKHYGKE